MPHCRDGAAFRPNMRFPMSSPSVEEAQEYCRRLARSHYENFSVASWFLPERLRQHFFNVYAYCRISDDLGDEVGDPDASLALLDQWQAELDACYAGHPRHPVFVALAETVQACDIPKHEFCGSAHRLSAGSDESLATKHSMIFSAIAANSANPVGHLVLYLCGYRDVDATGTRRLDLHRAAARQLLAGRQRRLRQRPHLSSSGSLCHFGVSEADIAAQRNTPAFCEMIRFEVDRARDWFRSGLPLISQVDRELAIDLELFSRGGQEILNAIERQGFAVLGHRPAISKPRKLALVARAALGKWL